MPTDFSRLRIWNEASDLAVCVYALSRVFPRDELYGLTSQLRRAAVSVSLNIAEGCGRETPKDRVHFLAIAQASVNEVRAILEIAVKLTYVHNVDVQELADRYRGLSAAIFSFKKTIHY